MPSCTWDQALAGVIEPFRQGPRLAQVAEGVLGTPHGRLHQAEGEDGHGRPVRFVLAAELLQAGRLLPQAPSKSPTTAETPATASWDTACR